MPGAYKASPHAAHRDGFAGAVLFYATYREWPASHYGNRFLMPAVALCVAPLAALIQAVTDARRPTIGPAGRAQT